MRGNLLIIFKIIFDYLFKSNVILYQNEQNVG